jgi:hypothetical protein
MKPTESQQTQKKETQPWKNKTSVVQKIQSVPQQATLPKISSDRICWGSRLSASSTHNSLDSPTLKLIQRPETSD